MSKLLVSDYDGTFDGITSNKDSIIENRYNVERFISRGNLFAFATGRSFVSIKDKTNEYSIPYNYLICNNGTSIFDSKDRLLHFNQIPHSIVLKTIEYLKRKHIILNVKYNNIYGEETSDYNEVAEIVCTVNIPDPDTLESIKEELNFLQVIFFSMQNSQRHTVSAGDEVSQFLVLKEPADKKDATKYISSLSRIPKRHIYTIGNDFNDYGMIECYNGYKMIGSSPELEFLNAPEIESVSELIRKIK